MRDVATSLVDRGAEPPLASLLPALVRSLLRDAAFVDENGTCGKFGFLQRGCLDIVCSSLASRSCDLWKMAALGPGRVGRSGFECMLCPR
eukprot:4656468-Pyramimonas_sp.AAC.1